MEHEEKLRLLATGNYCGIQYGFELSTGNILLKFINLDSWARVNLAENAVEFLLPEQVAKDLVIAVSQTLNTLREVRNRVQSNPSELRKSTRDFDS